MRIELVTGDITAEQVDAIVNAANSPLLGGGGVDGGDPPQGGTAILEECRALRASRYGRGLPVGQAVATTTGRLPARWVIHTVGPVFSKDEDRAPLLRSCYTTSLAVAASLDARSVAYPLISSGVYRWPKDDAVAQALTALHAEPTTWKWSASCSSTSRPATPRNASIRPPTTVGDAYARDQHASTRQMSDNRQRRTVGRSAECHRCIGVSKVQADICLSKGQTMQQPDTEHVGIRFGVLLAESDQTMIAEVEPAEDLPEQGYVPASGYRGRHGIRSDKSVVQLGHDVLRTAAEAIGSEVALVVEGVLAGIERRTPSTGPGFAIEDLQLKFGVKATLGVGKAVEALLSATGEATVEVTLKLRHQ